MPLRNLWALEPDECTVAEELGKEIQNCQVYFPTHDTGVDLIVVRGKKHVAIQVKGSRYYPGRRKGILGKESSHSWHQIKAKKLAESNSDFYIFVTWKTKDNEYGTKEFEPKFVIVPVGVLRERCRNKNKGRANIYHFYFTFEDDNVVSDTREKVPVDYSEFLKGWLKINEPLAEA